MSIKNILCYPHPDLRKKSLAVPVDFDQNKLASIVTDLEETMEKHEGIGLAAPQTALALRIFVVKTKDGVLTWINPEIVSRSLVKESGEEGCLSIPKVFGLVKRPKRITVRAQSMDRKTVLFEATGLYARVIQHEIDHLNGILFIDRAKQITSGENLLKEYEKKA